MRRGLFPKVRSRQGANHQRLDFPTPIFGSYESWNLNKSLCADRYSRYGAYGYLEGNETTRLQNWNGTFGSNEAAEIDWEQVDWAHLQYECLRRNSVRYRTPPSEGKILALYKSLDSDVQPRQSLNETDRTQPRAAVILRSWIGMKYTENDLYHIRSMMMELSLYSGAEYELILLIDCQGQKLPKETDYAAWKAFNAKHLPQELRNLAIWFNADMLKDWYPGIDVHAYEFAAFRAKVSLLTSYQSDIAVFPAHADLLKTTPSV